ncbi:transglycosylase domain-containing protein [Treponema sp. HNW]|uniref:transglycosylase domain-containing protein n=1 Tax=Treponema sp. HNW TaxID=3116654 RepID=UPI003D0FDECC
MFSVKNNVARYTAEFCLANNDQIKTITTTERRFIIIATARYIVKHIDYKDCYNYFFSKCYFGRNVFGLKNACKFYFNKNSTDLTEAEFTKLCLLIMNPAKYDFLPSSIDSDKAPP